MNFAINLLNPVRLFFTASHCSSGVTKCSWIPILIFIEWLKILPTQLNYWSYLHILVSFSKTDFQGFLTPCRQCPHVVVVAGFVCVNDPCGYAVEPLMPDRSKVRRQTKRDTEVYPCAIGRSSLPRRVCSSDVPMQANQRRRNCGRGPHLFKKG